MRGQHRGTQQSQNDESRKGDIDNQAVENGDMGRVQDPQPLQGMAQQDQEKRRCEGGEDSGEEGQNMSVAWTGDKASLHPALEVCFFIKLQSCFVLAASQQHNFIAVLLPSGLKSLL